MNANFRPGDTIKVYEKIKEGGKIRELIFEGVVIAIKGSGVNKSFTVRKIGADGVGVERIWSFECPSLSKIVVKRKGKVKRAKLYYLRKRVGKLALTVDQKEIKREKEKSQLTPISAGTLLEKSPKKENVKSSL